MSSEILLKIEMGMFCRFFEVGIVLGVFLEIKMHRVFCLETEVLLITKTETFLRRIIITSTHTNIF